MYDVKFEELFENDRDAVVSFLSLERRYSKLLKDYKECENGPCYFCKGDSKVAKIVILEAEIECLKEQIKAHEVRASKCLDPECRSYGHLSIRNNDDIIGDNDE